MGFKTQALMTGLGGGMVGSMMAPPGDKSKGFALGATLGVGGKVALNNPKVRDLIGADEMIENMKKSKNGQKVTQTSTNSKTTKGAPAASADPETKAQPSATKNQSISNIADKYESLGSTQRRAAKQKKIQENINLSIINARGVPEVPNLRNTR